MKKLFLTLVLGLASLGGLALTPSHADAAWWHRGWRSYYPGAYYGGSYYSPYYGAYAAPSYVVPSYSYTYPYGTYYSPGVTTYYSTPYYSTPSVVPYSTYSPTTTFYWGW